MWLVGTRMPFVFHSSALLCHPYVTRMYSYAIRMSVVSIRMSSVCHSHVLVCHSYVTRSTAMSFVCHSYVVLPWMNLFRNPFSRLLYHFLKISEFNRIITVRDVCSAPICNPCPDLKSLPRFVIFPTPIWNLFAPICNPLSCPYL